MRSTSSRRLSPLHQLAHRLLSAYEALHSLETAPTGSYLHQDTPGSTRQREDAWAMYVVVRDYVDTLSVDDRILVQRICRQGHSQRRVARRLRLTRGTVQYRLRRIYAALGDRLLAAGWAP